MAISSADRSASRSIAIRLAPCVRPSANSTTMRPAPSVNRCPHESTKPRLPSARHVDQRAAADVGRAAAEVVVNATRCGGMHRWALGWTIGAGPSGVMGAGTNAARAAAASRVRFAEQPRGRRGGAAVSKWQARAAGHNRSAQQGPRGRCGNRNRHFAHRGFWHQVVHVMTPAKVNR